MNPGKWRYKYDYQSASWIVYRGSRRLCDYYPSEKDAAAAANEKNQQREEKQP